MRLILCDDKHNFDEGETVIAYQPRDHPEPSPAIVQKQFDASDPRSTYVRLKWLDTGLERSTHWQNVSRRDEYEAQTASGPAGPPPLPQIDLHIRMPQALNERLKAIAETQSVTLNQAIILLLTSASGGFQFNEKTEA